MKVNWQLLAGNPNRASHGPESDMADAATQWHPSPAAYLGLVTEPTAKHTLAWNGRRSLLGLAHSVNG